MVPVPFLPLSDDGDGKCLVSVPAGIEVPQEKQATTDEGIPDSGRYLPDVPRKGTSWSSISTDPTTCQEASSSPWPTA